MSWERVLGHDLLVERFRTAVARGRLASTFLFVGPNGIGKRRFATELARCLLCTATGESQLSACGQCDSCRLMAAGSHPDFMTVGKPADRASIPIELLIGDREHRNRDGLCHDISLSPFHGGRKIAILDDADFLQEEGANCLLKTLEEPPPRSVLILLSTSLARQLPTIRSRSQIVHFSPLAAEHIEQILRELDDFSPPVPIGQLVALADGSVRTALQWADEPLLDFRKGFLATLSKPQWPSPLLAKQVAECIDQAGKDAAPRRDRFRLIATSAEHFYRGLLYHLIGREVTGDEILTAAIEKTAGHWQAGTEGVARCLDRCLDAHREVSANANMTLLVESWIDDLSGYTRQRTGAGMHVH